MVGDSLAEIAMKQRKLKVSYVHWTRRLINSLGYMARKRETDCGNTVNPDCCGVVDIVQCELPICRKLIIGTP